MYLYVCIIIHFLQQIQYVNRNETIYKFRINAVGNQVIVFSHSLSDKRKYT